MVAAATRDEMLRRARDLVPALKERAAEAEDLRRLPDDTVRDLHETGLWRVLQPARVGGGELDYGMLVDVPVELGQGCGSTAWVFVNLASHHWMLAMWPQPAQDEVWGEQPDALIASSLIYPAGRAAPVEGGYLVSGQWPFCSGIDPSDWVMLGTMVARGPEAPEPRMVVVPKASLEVTDTWFVAGLSGTGSKNVACQDVFVPAHMTLASLDVRGGPTPGAGINPSPLYTLPVAALFPHLIAAPILGMAMGVYADFVATVRSRISTYNDSKIAGHITTQLHVGEAGALIDGARLMLRSNCEEAARLAEAGTAPTIEDKMRWRRDAAFAATMSAKAADELYRTSGGAANLSTNPLQRRFRDIHAGLGHIGVSWDVNGTGFGRVALGLPPDNPNI
jgi:3-hydroxy-9,10-secoandrosta-1,3,5(10)-triene-9,17-dione monooxygenase